MFSHTAVSRVAGVLHVCCFLPADKISEKNVPGDRTAGPDSPNAAESTGAAAEQKDVSTEGEGPLR